MMVLSTLSSNPCSFLTDILNTISPASALAQPIPSAQLTLSRHLGGILFEGGKKLIGSRQDFTLLDEAWRGGTAKQRRWSSLPRCCEVDEIALGSVDVEQQSFLTFPPSKPAIGRHQPMSSYRSLIVVPAFFDKDLGEIIPSWR